MCGVKGPAFLTRKANKGPLIPLQHELLSHVVIILHLALLNANVASSSFA